MMPYVWSHVVPVTHIKRLPRGMNSLNLIETRENIRCSLFGGGGIILEHPTIMESSTTH